MIGQTELLQKLKSYTLNTFPRSILLIGSQGSGKHTLTEELSKYYQVELVKILNDTTSEDLIEYEYTATNKFYLIDLSVVPEKQQNKYLKFIEEPSNTSHIILIAESESTVLTTILNRCLKFFISDYSINELKQIRYFDNDLVYNICNTPGKLLSLDSFESINNTINFCTLMLDNLQKASLPNILSISYRLNFDENYDKIDIELFYSSILYISYQKYLETNNNFYYSIYLETTDSKRLLTNKSYNKETIVLNYLEKLYQVSRNNLV